MALQESCPCICKFLLYNFIAIFALKNSIYYMQTETLVNREELITEITQSVTDFGDKHIRPYMMDWDDNQIFPRELFKQLGDLGLMGMLVPEKYNGAGLGYREYVAAIVALSKIDSSIGLSMAAHNSLCTNHILQFANDDQKAKWLPKLATGEWLGAWGLTEPNTGSDAGNMRTTAVLEGDEWVLNGAKNFITHGISGDIAVVVARTGEPNTSGNASAFVVERGTPGFSGGKKESK